MHHSPIAANLHFNWMPKFKPSATARLCFRFTTSQLSLDKHTVLSACGNFLVPSSTSRHRFNCSPNSNTLPTSVPTAKHPSNNCKSLRAHMAAPPTKQQLVMRCGTSMTRRIFVPCTANKQTTPLGRSPWTPTASTHVLTSAMCTSSTHVMFTGPALLKDTIRISS